MRSTGCLARDSESQTRATGGLAGGGSMVPNDEVITLSEKFEASKGADKRQQVPNAPRSFEGTVNRRGKHLLDTNGMTH